MLGETVGGGLVFSSSNNSHHNHHHKHSTGNHFLPVCPFFSNIPSNNNQGTSEFCVDIMFLRILGGLDLYYFITLIPNLIFILYLLFKLKISVKILKKTDSLLLPALYTFVWCVCVVHLITCLSTASVAIIGENIFYLEENFQTPSTFQNIVNNSHPIPPYPNHPISLISTQNIPSNELDIATKICLSILNLLMEFIELCVVVYMMHHFSPRKLIASLSNLKVLVRSAIIAGLVSVLDNAAAVSVMFIFPFYNETGFPSIMTTNVLESALQETIVRGLFTIMYIIIIILPCIGFMKDRVPQRKSFYLYILFLMTLHCVNFVGGVLLLTCQSVGICFTMSSRVLYFALFGPVLYFTFLDGNLNRSVYEQITMETEGNNAGNVTSSPSAHVIAIDRVFDSEENEEERIQTLMTNIKKNKRRKPEIDENENIYVNDENFQASFPSYQSGTIN